MSPDRLQRSPVGIASVGTAFALWAPIGSERFPIHPPGPTGPTIGNSTMIQRILLALLIALGIGVGAQAAQAAPQGPANYGHATASNTKFGVAHHGYSKSAPRVRVGGSIGAHIGGKSGGVHIGIGFGNHSGKHGYGKARVWIPGRYVTECQRVWVPGRTEQVWCPPVYETHYDSCGHPYQVLVKPGHYNTVHHPGYWENRNVQVWQPGRWSC